MSVGSLMGVLLRIMNVNTIGSSILASGSWDGTLKTWEVGR